MSIEEQFGEVVRAIIREELAAASGNGDDQLLSADEVAALLAYPNKHSVYALKRSGKLKAVSLGDKSIRFRRGTVRAFIQERES
jgi:predicted DNA-binding transcriptional regulator AlpA